MINDYKAPSSTSSFINTSTQVHVQYTATPTHTSHLLGINAITKYLLSVSLMSINNVSIEEKEGDIIKEMLFTKQFNHYQNIIAEINYTKQ